jgi:peptidyl-prolyl cis-trans isomerase SurA
MAFSFLKRPLMALVFWALPLAGLSSAQDFSPRLFVNDRVITQFEVDQRIAFLKLLRSPGDIEQEALKGLVEDRLRVTEAERLELEATEEEVKAGIEEFAQRANLTADQFVQELDKIGVAAETLRDFVSAGVVWRKVVRARFQGQVPISENDVDLALEAATRPGRLRVLMSELVLPVPEGEDGLEQMELATSLSQSLRGDAEFAAAAQEYSAAPTGKDGGRLDWLPLASLPGPVASAAVVLEPGEVSEPLMVPGAVVLFMLRDLALDTSGEPIRVTVEWAEFLVPDDPAETARVKAAVDTCYDLNALAKGLPADRLTVTSQPASQVPGDVALELARLDPGESSVALKRGGFRRFLMLCGREEELEEPPTRDQVRQRVIGQKLDGLAEAYLQELRSAAIIREP